MSALGRERTPRRCLKADIAPNCRGVGCGGKATAQQFET
jgi:hypothetical protein